MNNCIATCLQVLGSEQNLKDTQTDSRRKRKSGQTYKKYRNWISNQNTPQKRPGPDGFIGNATKC